MIPQWHGIRNGAVKIHQISITWCVGGQQQKTLSNFLYDLIFFLLLSHSFKSFPLLLTLSCDDCMLFSRLLLFCWSASLFVQLVIFPFLPVYFIPLLFFFWLFLWVCVMWVNKNLQSTACSSCIPSWNIWTLFNSFAAPSLSITLPPSLFSFFSLP